MSASFQDRFKGKTSLMTKTGVESVIRDSDNPISKPQQQNQYQMDDFTAHQRYAHTKVQAQTFDQNSGRPFFSPTEAHQTGYAANPARRGSLTPNPPQMMNPQSFNQANSYQQMNTDRFQQQQGLHQGYHLEKVQQSTSSQFDSIEQLKLAQMMQQNARRSGQANTFLSDHKQNPHAHQGMYAQPQQDQFLLSNNMLRGGPTSYSPIPNQRAGMLNADYSSKNFAISPNQRMSQPQHFGKTDPTGIGSSHNWTGNAANESTPASTTTSSTASSFKPYTLSEYKNIQKSNSFKVGGLGPNIGGDDWLLRKDQAEKRNEFARQVQSINTQKLLQSEGQKPPPASVKQSKEPSTREKALDFARGIPKPSPTFNNEIQMKSTTMSNRQQQPARSGSFQDFQQLEQNHMNFLNRVEKISK